MAARDIKTLGSFGWSIRAVVQVVAPQIVIALAFALVEQKAAAPSDLSDAADEESTGV